MALKGHCDVRSDVHSFRSFSVPKYPSIHFVHTILLGTHCNVVRGSSNKDTEVQTPSYGSS